MKSKLYFPIILIALIACNSKPLIAQVSWPHSDVTTLTSASIDYSSFSNVVEVGLSLDPRSTRITWNKNNWITFQYIPVVSYVRTKSGRSFDFTDLVSQDYAAFSATLYATIEIPALKGGVGEVIETSGRTLVRRETGEKSSDLVSDSPIWRDRDSYKPICRELREKHGDDCTRKAVKKHGYEPRVKQLKMKDVRIQFLPDVDKNLGLLFEYESLASKGNAAFSQNRCEESLNHFNQALDVELPKSIKDNLGINDSDIRQKMESCNQKVKEQKEVEKSRELVDKAKAAERDGDNEKALEFYKKAREVKSNQNIVNSIEYLEKEVEQEKKRANRKETNQKEVTKSQRNYNASTTYDNNAKSDRTNSQKTTKESAEEYRKWKSDNQSSIQSMLDEMDRQSQREAQIRKQKWDAIEKVSLNAFGTALNMLDQHQAKKRRKKYNRIVSTLTKTINAEDGKFNKESKAYLQTGQNLDQVLEQYGRKLSPYVRDEIVRKIERISSVIKIINEEREKFTEAMTSDYVQRLAEKKVKRTPMYTSIIKKDIVEHKTVINNSFRIKRISFDLASLLSTLTNEDDGKRVYQNATEEIAEIARDLDKDRPSVEPPSHGYYGYYTPYLPNSEENLVKQIKTHQNPQKALQLITIYQKYFPSGTYIKDMNELKSKKQNEKQSKLTLRRSYLNKANVHRRIWKRKQKQGLFFVGFTTAPAAGYALYGVFTDNSKAQWIGLGGMIGTIPLLAMIMKGKDGKGANYHHNEEKKYRKKARELQITAHNFQIGKANAYAFGFRLNF